MLLELCIGDAYGVPFEFAPVEFVHKYNDGLSYHCQGPGQYSDDGQMSLAIAEHILSGDQWTKLNLANRFVDVFKRDIRGGYASRFQAFLQQINSGEEFLEKILPQSERSGCAMRAPIIGVYRDIGDIKEKAALQASITHNTNSGIQSAQAAALAMHYFIYHLGSKKELPDFIQANVGGEHWNMPYVGWVGNRAWMCVRAAISAIVANNDLTSILKHSVKYTGDVDTVCAIALGIGSESKEIEDNFSANLHTNFENGPFGYEYIVNTCSELRKFTLKQMLF